MNDIKLLKDRIKKNEDALRGTAFAGIFLRNDINALNDLYLKDRNGFEKAKENIDKYMNRIRVDRKLLNDLQLEGTGKGKNKWIDFLKSEAKRRNKSYWEILKDPNVKKLYKKGKGASASVIESSIPSLYSENLDFIQDIFDELYLKYRTHITSNPNALNMTQEDYDSEALLLLRMIYNFIRRNDFQEYVYTGEIIITPEEQMVIDDAIQLFTEEDDEETKAGTGMLEELRKREIGTKHNVKSLEYGVRIDEIIKRLNNVIKEFNKINRRIPVSNIDFWGIVPVKMDKLREGITKLQMLKETRNEELLRALMEGLINIINHIEALQTNAGM